MTAKDTTLAGGTFLLCLLGALAAYFVVVRPYHDARVALTFVETKCLVVRKEFAAGATRRFAHPAIEVVYEAAGRIRRSTGFDDRGDNRATQLHSRSTAQEMLDRYRINEKYPCWYDPDEPTRVVLERGRSYLWPIAIVAFLLACGLVYAIRVAIVDKHPPP